MSYFCSFGHNRLSISTEGDVFPCHRFVGNEDFKIGNVHTNTLNKDYMKDLDEKLNVEKN